MSSGFVGGEVSGPAAAAAICAALSASCPSAIRWMTNECPRKYPLPAIVPMDTMSRNDFRNGRRDDFREVLSVRSYGPRGCIS